ncbi:hypothetical protein BDQ17DRAFT_1438546 [Cyathus striatus]|nr:hypothetical protein BDQ17DRAFT_1438546 [Cyathus striatus]
MNAPLPIAAPQNNFVPQNPPPINAPVLHAYHNLPADLHTMHADLPPIPPPIRRGRERGRGHAGGAQGGITNLLPPVEHNPAPLIHQNLQQNPPIVAETIHAHHLAQNIPQPDNIPPLPPAIPQLNIPHINTPPPAVQNMHQDHPIIDEPIPPPNIPPQNVQQAADIQQPITPPHIDIPQVILPPPPVPAPIPNVQRNAPFMAGNNQGYQWRPPIQYPNPLQAVYCTAPRDRVDSSGLQDSTGLQWTSVDSRWTLPGLYLY